MKKLILISHLFIITLIIISCGSTNPSGDSDGSIISTPTHTSIPTQAVSSTLSPTLTATPTSTKTPLPLNTLTALERQNFVRVSLSNSSDCNMPCWWGITPGKTTWKETNEFLSYLGATTSEISGYDLNSILHGAGGFNLGGVSNSVLFQETHGIIDAILVISDKLDSSEKFQSLWDKYIPKQILEVYGIPSRVFLNIPTSSSPSPYRGYYLWIFYDQKGFMIRYFGKVLDAPILKVCPEFKEDEYLASINISMQSLTNSLPLERFDAILEDVRKETETSKLRKVYSLQKATGMNEEEFHNLFMQEEELICFETPSSIWDVKQ